jgi:uncharacterized protein (TIGR03435 family)
LHFAEIIQSGGVVPRRGHPLLIEYWTTSCAPCIANIPHLNALFDEFEKHGVDFLMLTNETQAEVIPFLKKYPMNGMVAIDPGFSTNRLLSAPGVPVTLLIDRDSKLAAITLPDRVTPKVLLALIEGSPVQFPSLDLRLETSSATSPHPFFPASDGTESNSAVFVAVRPGADGPLGSIGGITEFKGAFKLRDLLIAAYKVAPQQIELPDDLDAVYSVKAWVPPFDSAGVMPVIKAALLSAANLRVQEQTKLMEVLVLKHFPGKLHSEPRSANAMNDLIEMRSGSIHSVGGIRAEVLCEQLQRLVHKPIILEGTTEGTYAVSLQRDPNDADGLRHEFELTGISFGYETRPVKVYVFSPAEKAQP